MAHWGMEDVQACFGDTADLNTRQITVGGQRLGLLFLDGLTSGGDIAEQVLKPLMETVTPGSIQEVLTQAERARVYCAVAERTQDPAQTVDKLLHGYCAVIFPGTDTALCFETKTSARRGPSAPESENTVKGAKDAFTETMRINTSLLRRHLRSAQLRFVQKTVGLRSQTAVTVCFLADLTDPALVRRMEQRLAAIDIDGMLTPASVEEYVTGSRKTAFPLLQYTERPDTASACLLEGKVVILVDNSPSAMILPTSVFDMIEEANDYYFPTLTSVYLKISRTLINLMTIFLTPVFLLFMQNPNWLPKVFAFVAVKDTVNIPLIYQLLMLEAAIDGLRLAALNTPSMLSTPLSVIAGLVMGEFSVESGWFNAEVMLYMAFVAVANYTQPNFELGYALKFMRLALLILTALFNGWGFVMGCVLVVCSICFNKTLSGRSYLHVSLK